MRALQMLVIACPCALVISTPVSLVSAMTNAASRGVLVKGGRYLEVLSRVGAFAFDKTGTLTAGRPVVTDVIDVCTCEECAEGCGLEHAAALEVQSSHPLAQAVLAEAQARRVAVPPAENVTLLSGRGVEGTVNGRRVTVASHPYFDEQFPHSAAVCQQADELAAQGKTVILIRHDDEVCALFGVADTLRPASRRVIAELRARGIRTVMLTGDGEAVAAEIGRQVGCASPGAGRRGHRHGRRGLGPGHGDRRRGPDGRRSEPTALTRVAQRQDGNDCQGQHRARAGGEGARLRAGGGGPGDAVDGHRCRRRGVRGGDPARHAAAPDDRACI
jgi:Cd2+/Zn2+-exporting ATPase